MNIREKITVLFSLGFVVTLIRKFAWVLKLHRQQEKSDESVDYVMVWDINAVNKAQCARYSNMLGVGVESTSDIERWVSKQLISKGLIVQEIDSAFWDRDAHAKAEEVRLKAERSALRRRRDVLKGKPFKLKADDDLKSAATAATAAAEPPTPTVPPTPGTASMFQKTKIVNVVAAPFDQLCELAETMKVRKLWTADQTQRPFNILHAANGRFQGFLETRTRGYFLDSERQKMVDKVLMSIKSQTDLRSVLPQLHQAGILQYYPLHNNDTRNTVTAKMMKNATSDDSLQAIANYFGTEISFYFAWLAFYTNWLAVPSLIGIALWLFHPAHGEMDIVTVAYSIGLSVWGTLFLEFWKRRSSELAWRWGTSDFETLEAIEEPRPNYYGVLMKSKITDKMETYYPSLRRRLKYTLSYPICLLLVVAAAGLMLFSFWLEDYTLELQKQHYFSSEFLNSHLPTLPVVFYAASISPFNSLYSALAVKLTDWENHRTATDYNTHVIIKQVLFYFCNSYLSLFYCAFWRFDFDGLRRQLSALLITQQVIGNLLEVVIPWIMEKIRLGKIVLRSKSVDSETELRMTALEEESQQEPSADMFFEYIELVTQFGYVALFGWCWPPAALCAFANNLVEARSDCYKLCSQYQRPPCRDAGSIGTWYNVLEFFSYMAVVTNFASVAVHEFFVRKGPRLLASWTGDDLIYLAIIIVVAEHALFVLKFLLAAVIPDVTGPVATAMARERYQEIVEAEGHKHSSLADVGLATTSSSEDGKGTGASSKSKAPVFAYDRITGQDRGPLNDVDTGIVFQDGTGQTDAASQADARQFLRFLTTSSSASTRVAGSGAVANGPVATSENVEWL